MPEFDLSSVGADLVAQLQEDRWLTAMLDVHLRFVGWLIPSNVSGDT